MHSFHACLNKDIFNFRVKICFEPYVLTLKLCLSNSKGVTFKVKINSMDINGSEGVVESPNIYNSASKLRHYLINFNNFISSRLFLIYLTFISLY